LSLRDCRTCAYSASGEGAIVQPAFYAHVHPEPKSYAEHSVGSAGAFYSRDLDEFILLYDAERMNGH